MSGPHIARQEHATGTTPGTVKSWLSRGRIRLAEILSDLDPARSVGVHDA